MKTRLFDNAKNIIITFFLLFTAACGSNSDVGSSDPSISGEPSPELFDIWTFKVESSSLICPILQIYLNGVEEEYRIYQTSSGCTINDKSEDGTELTSDGRLFDEVTTCEANENKIQLERTFSLNTYFGDDCVNEVKYVVQLELSGDLSSLDGELTGSISYSGTCIDTDDEPLHDCEFQDDVTGVRGRHGRSLEPVQPE